MSSNNVATGFAFGFLTRMGFDFFNKNKIIKSYQKSGRIPNKKSYGVGFGLTFLFGSLGLFYTNPILAIILTLFELPLLVFSLGLFNIMLRPVMFVLVFIGMLSYNKMILHLFGRYG